MQDSQTGKLVVLIIYVQPYQAPVRICKCIGNHLKYNNMRWKRIEDSNMDEGHKTDDTRGHASESSIEISNDIPSK